MEPTRGGEAQLVSHFRKVNGQLDLGFSSALAGKDDGGHAAFLDDCPSQPPVPARLREAERAINGPTRLSGESSFGSSADSVEMAK